jgi:putative ABC transport system ATP-binding protein
VNTARALRGLRLAPEQRSAADAALINLEEIAKRFHADGVTVTALHDVSINVDAGEFIAIVGPSGCGKSTLLSILGLLDTPSGGAYWLGGRPVASLSRAERALVRNEQIGFVFQSFHLIGDLTVLENVELPLSYRGVSVAERRERARAALEQVGMFDRLAHYPTQLSGGQQQRVAIARAVIGRPLVLLADEPTGNLDSANGESVMELFGALHAQGTTICLVTHDPRCEAAASRVIRLHDGRVVDHAEAPRLGERDSVPEATCR